MKTKEVFIQNPPPGSDQTFASTLHRLFVPLANIKGNTISIYGEPLKKLRRVLRLKTENKISVFDGTGYEYLTRIVSLTPSQGELHIVKKINPIRESSLEIHLCQALTKSNKMDLIVKKAVELGVFEIHPFYSARTVPIYDQRQVKRRLERWQKISQEASQQSGRIQIPKVHLPIDFLKVLNLPPKASLKLILEKHYSQDSLKNVLKTHQEKTGIFFLVGPEGGFTPEEITFSLNHGFTPLSLGERILRTETVALTFLSILQYELGDIN